MGRNRNEEVELPCFHISSPLLPAGIDSHISGTSQDLVAKDACGITGKNLCEIGPAKSNLLPGPQSFREKSTMTGNL